MLLVVIAVLLAAASIFLVVSTLTFHTQSVIGFGASLNATTLAQSQAVRVNLEDWNTLEFKNSLPLGDGLSNLNLSSGQCGGLYPGGIAVYQGAYDLSNMSSGAPLAIYSPGFISCPGLATLPATNSFTFNPVQNVTTYVDLVGYWTSGSTPQPDGGAIQGVLHRFLPGVYTVIAGNEWGNTKVMYFHVNGTTGNLERTGPISSFPASWLDPCNQSATGNTTTMAYLGLNSSSVLDHINLEQVYGQIVNSSSFAYQSVGNGWVVTQWDEAGESASDTTPVVQVVGTFILTSGGAPSGYVYAFYNPVNVTVAIKYTEILVTSCTA
jgi:hypothetical protein